MTAIFLSLNPLSVWGTLKLCTSRHRIIPPLFESWRVLWPTLASRVRVSLFGAWEARVLTYRLPVLLPVNPSQPASKEVQPPLLEGERLCGAETNHSIWGQPEPADCRCMPESTWGQPIPVDCRCMPDPNPDPPSLTQIGRTIQLTQRVIVVLRH